MTKQFQSILLIVLTLLLMFGRESAANSEKTSEFIKVLQSEAPLFEKVRACRQLGEVGTEEAIPVLASLLNHEALAANARNALERIPGPASAAALRKALAETQGAFLVGVIHSLAVLQDEKAVPDLIALSESADVEVARASLWALGRIPAEASIAKIRNTLNSGNEILRAEAAAACLLAAQSSADNGEAKQAAVLYSAVLDADVPMTYQIAAVRGTILTRQSDRVPFVVEQLRSNNQDFRNVALLTIRDIPDDELAAALVAELPQASPDLQIQLIYATRDCHNDASSRTIQAYVESSDPGIRLAALTVLADIGGPETAETFIQTLLSQPGPEEVAIATNRLETMPGETVDALILDALKASKDEKPRISLIRLLKTRETKQAKNELFRQAKDQNQKVRIAALQAMNLLVTPDDLEPLIALTKGLENESVRGAAELTVYHACMNSEDKTKPAAIVFSELNNADRLEDQKSWISVLSLLGYDEALPTIFAMIKDGDEEIAKYAVYQLRRWPDPTPMNDLYQVIEEKPELRDWALAAIIQLATAAADRQQMTELELVACFQRVGQLEPSVQAKHGILSGLGRVQHIKSVRLSESYLNDPEVEMEAGFAVVNACQSISSASELDEVEGLLDRIAALDDDNLQEQVKKLKRRRKTWWTPIFNGKDLSGWEMTGEAEWFVKDSILVGTQTTGKGGDLVTNEIYDDFELRFTYKVKWPANTGVWFRYNKETQKGYQFDILKYANPEAYSGTLYCPGKLFLTQNLDESLENRDGWNEGIIRAHGDQVTLTLNGREVGQCTDSTHETGRFGIQVHSGDQFKGMEVAFKRIEIRRFSVN